VILLLTTYLQENQSLDDIWSHHRYPQKVDNSMLIFWQKISLTRAGPTEQKHGRQADKASRGHDLNKYRLYIGMPKILI